MFIGHFGLGFAAKRWSPDVSLGTLFLAAQFIDLLWPLFLIAGWEEVAIDPGNTAFTPLHFVSYPYSHSLLAVVFWAAVFGLVYFMTQKSRKSAFIGAGLVVSHWILDLVTHRPDLPLAFEGSAKLGMGLWNHPAATIALELALFFSGVGLYSYATRPRNKWGENALWALILLLVVIYMANAFGGPPPDATTLQYVALAQWLFIAYGYWLNRNRTSATSYYFVR
jgi:membrane-bound metal-dependent hydrolase YbcI (DUF457 family)